MIQFARVLAAGGLLWLQAGFPLAQAAPESKPAETPAAQIQTGPRPARPAPRATVGAGMTECAWTGKRIVGLLIRDDPDPADKFLRFYEMFGCPVAHLGPVMRCVADSDGGDTQSKALTERIDACWDKPSVRFLKK
ncbi:MAG: hypothetical protein FJX42_07925 [Alphaproteobacteria bacterium]|nr:hypothetical protein [Alphaproteobacteria bacterium]